jgi:hypothetical protein
MCRAYDCVKWMRYTAQKGDVSILRLIKNVAVSWPTGSGPCAIHTANWRPRSFTASKACEFHKRLDCPLSYVPDQTMQTRNVTHAQFVGGNTVGRLVI